MHTKTKIMAIVLAVILASIGVLLALVLPLGPWMGLGTGAAIAAAVVTRGRPTTVIRTQPRLTDPLEVRPERESSEASIDLYWLPLGAGGWFVRLNGRIYEAIHAVLARRRPLDLYHSALEVRVPEGRFVIENSWPIPDAHGASRGVVVEGPVFSRWIARFRALRYEVRRWREGVIPDADEAVASPQRLSDDPRRARRLLDLVGSVPNLVWGRDELRTGEMWNSNSVISWLLARSGLPTEAISPPAGGRAPGWEAGVITARHQQRSDDGAPAQHRRTRWAAEPSITPWTNRLSV